MLFVTVSLLLLPSAWGTTTQRPLWITNPPVPNKGVAAVGVGEGRTLNDAQAEAKRHGWMELVENVVGVQGTSRMEAQSSTTDSKLKQELELSTEVVEIKTLSTRNKHFERLEDGSYRCYLLLFLPESEVLRLRKAASAGPQSKLLSRLTVETVPIGAKVLLDGEPVGKSPVTLLLPPKTYALSASLDGYRKHDERVTLSVGSDSTVAFPLAESTGKLMLEVRPSNASVVIDGNNFGTGSTVVSLAVGAHELLVSAKGFKPNKRTITMRDGRTLRMQVYLQRDVQSRRLASEEEEQINGLFEEEETPKKPKLFEGMTKQKVQELFGPPDTVDISGNEASWRYSRRSFCDNQYSCYIHFSGKKVDFFGSIKPEYVDILR